MNEKNKNYIPTEDNKIQNKSSREGVVELIKEQLSKINKASKGETGSKGNRKH